MDFGFSLKSLRERLEADCSELISLPHLGPPWLCQGLWISLKCVFFGVTLQDDIRTRAWSSHLVRGQERGPRPPREGLMGGEE